ncbi:MAG: glycosyltransferase family 4 protein [Bacteroidales bacterium]|nr:glycosyltransferase family 4 protein [Bacteroidales bacterium]
MIKILFFVQSLGKGGAERLVLEIANELSKHSNVSCKIVSFSQLNEYTSLTNNIVVEYCDSKIILSLFRQNNVKISSLTKIIEDYQPDIIHSNVYLCELLTREKLYPNIAYFTHCHNNMPEFKSFGIKTFFNKSLLTKYYEKKRIERKYIKCDNQFISISQDTNYYYNNNLNKKLKKNVHYLPNAIDYNKFYYKGTRDINKELNLIMVGHMSNYKNQIFLIDVLKILRKNDIDANLTLVGDWRNNGQKIIEKAKSLQIESFLKMPGLIENIEEELKTQHIYVHSAYYEPFGLVLLEAMASGLPVITLDGKGNRDLIEPGKNGYMIYEQNAELFAQTIIDLWNDKQKYREMSEYAQEYAKQYDIKPYVEKLLVLYQNAIDGKK